MKTLHYVLLRYLMASLLAGASVLAQPADARPETVLFIGNSFLFGGGSPVRFYRPDNVTDLNGGGVGGVPALFKLFSEQAGHNFEVSLETAPGKGLDYHFSEMADLIGRGWDRVVMSGYSTLDRAKPGDPALLVNSTRQVAELLHRNNQRVDIRLIATWPRADQIYPEKGHWHGRTVEAMALDIRQAYERAAAGTPFVSGVIPVGEAWLRAMKYGVADPNPYDGISFGQVSLWTYDHYHASVFGYYLEALMIFGDLTGLDPRSLGKQEHCAFELGLSQEQAVALQGIASDELAARKDRPPLKTFSPVPFKRSVGHIENRP